MSKKLTLQMLAPTASPSAVPVKVAAKTAPAAQPLDLWAGRPGPEATAPAKASTPVATAPAPTPPVDLWADRAAAKPAKGGLLAAAAKLGAAGKQSLLGVMSLLGAAIGRAFATAVAAISGLLRGKAATAAAADPQAAGAKPTVVDGEAFFDAPERV